MYYESKHFGDYGADRMYNRLLSIIPVVLYSVLEEFDIPLLSLSCVSTIFLILTIYLILKLLFKDESSIFLIFLFPIIFERSLYLAPYPLFMFLFAIAFYMFLKASRSEEEKLYIFSSLFLALSIYTATIALTLSIVPLLYALFSIRDKTTLLTEIKISFRYYVYLLVFLLPWLYWHLTVGGIGHFYSSPFTWYSTEGLRVVNSHFWGYGSIARLDLLNLYLDQLIPNIFLLPCLIFILIGILNYKNNKKLIGFCISWIVVYQIPFIFKGVSAFSRYLFPLIIPLILISTIGAISLKRYNKKIFSLAVALILIIGIVSLNLFYFNSWQITRVAGNSNTHTDFMSFKWMIDDDKNIFCRHHSYQYFFHDNYFITQSDMSKNDAINFISWSSDEEVKKILRKNNIGWVILYNNENRWEHDYYCWVTILHGKDPIHYIKIKESNYFERVKVGKIYTLYKFIDSS